MKTQMEPFAVVMVSIVVLFKLISFIPIKSNLEALTRGCTMNRRAASRSGKRQVGPSTSHLTTPSNLHQKHIEHPPSSLSVMPIQLEATRRLFCLILSAQKYN